MGPEAILQKQVIDYARLRGWRVAHFAPATVGKRVLTPVKADGAGFPDLVLVRDRLLFVELKAPGKYPGPRQREWLDALRTFEGGPDGDGYGSMVEVYVWRPSDWPTIELMLA